MADTPQTDNVLTVEEANRIMAENKKTLAQETTELVRYPGLKTISKLGKALGVLFVIVFMVLALVMLFMGEDWGERVLGFFSFIGLGIIYFVFWLFIGDLCQVLVDIEENTRKK